MMPLTCRKFHQRRGRWDEGGKGAWEGICGGREAEGRACLGVAAPEGVHDCQHEDVEAPEAVGGLHGLHLGRKGIEHVAAGQAGGGLEAAAEALHYLWTAAVGIRWELQKKNRHSRHLGGTEGRGGGGGV